MKNHPAVRLSLAFLNLTYIFRLLVTLLQYLPKISLQSKLLALIVVLLAAGLTAFSLTPKLLLKLVDYLRKQRTVFELFVLFWAGSQILSWLLQHISEQVAFEVRGWFIGLAVWLALSTIWINLRSAFSDLEPQLATPPGDQDPPGKDNILRSTRLISLLAGLPVLGYWVYTQLINPLPVFYEYDPEFAYMLNSISPFQDLELYALMDHPGTFLQLLGSGVNALLAPITIPQAGSRLVLPVFHPGSFLVTARFLVLILTLFSITYLIKTQAPFQNTSDLLAAVSLPLIYFASHQQSFLFTAIWSPNSFNLALGSLLFYLLIRYLLRAEEPDPEKLNLFALAAGIIATFQVYMVVWAVGICATILFFHLLKKGQTTVPSLLAGGRSMLSSLKGYLLGTLIILPHYGDFLNWLYSLFSSQGLYGRGEKGILSQNQLLTNFSSLFSEAKALFIYTGVLAVLVILGLLLAGRKSRPIRSSAAVSLGLFLQLLLSFLVVLKHPRERYLLTIAAALPLLWILAVSLLKNQKSLGKIVPVAGFLITAAAFCLNLVGSLSDHQHKLATQQTYTQTVTDFVTDYAAANQLDRSQIERFWTYGTYGNCFALWFGNEYAKNLFTEPINELCSPQNDYAISIWSGKILPLRLGYRTPDLDSRSIIIADPGVLEEQNYPGFSVYRTDLDNLEFLVRGKLPD